MDNQQAQKNNGDNMFDEYQLQGTKILQENSKFFQEEIDKFHITHQDLIKLNKSKISDVYEFVKVLGKGGMAVVKMAVHKQTNISRAVKILNKHRLTKREIGQSIKEIKILARLDSPNIAQIHEYFEDEKYIYVVEDLYSGGELVEKIIKDGDEEGLSEVKACKIMKQVLSALSHCHKNNVAYRDLKPENIMLTHDSYDNIKLVDFGLSYIYKDGEIMTEKVGTPYFVSPEVLDGAHTSKCDLWSAGVLLYLLLIGYPPFEGEHSSDIFAAIRKGQYNVTDSEWDDVSDDAKDLIAKLLVKDVEERYSAEQALQHKWIQQYNEQSTVDKKVMEKSLSNLKRFRKGTKLQEAIYSFIVDNIITRKEKQDLLRCFSAIDKKGDGVISREELKSAYRKTLYHDGHEKNEKDLEHIFERLEKDFGDHLNFSDWLNATVEQAKLLSKENLEIAFKMFDSDKDGKVSVQDIKNIFSCSKQVHNETWVELIKDMDHNDNDYISHSDFIKVMQEHIHSRE